MKNQVELNFDRALNQLPKPTLTLDPFNWGLLCLEHKRVGSLHQECFCQARVWHTKEKSVVLIYQYDDNPSKSITNAYEDIASLIEIYHTGWIKDTTWFEAYAYQNAFSKVQFRDKIYQWYRYPWWESSSYIELQRSVDVIHN